MVAILYIRIGPGDRPAEHQIAETRTAGIAFDEALVDEGISSSSSSLKTRPAGGELFARLGQDDTLIVRWIDNLGRNYPDMTRTIQNFLDKGVTIRTVIGGVTFYGAPHTSSEKESTDTLITFLNAASDVQAELFEKAQKAALDSAKASKNASLGRRPSYDRHTLEIVLDMLSRGAATTTIAEATGLSRTAVSRIKRDPDSARKALLRWEGVSGTDE